jgi:hypothetical protein
LDGLAHHRSRRAAKARVTAANMAGTIVQDAYRALDALASGDEEDLVW